MSNYLEKYFRGLEGSTIEKFVGLTKDDFDGEPFPTYRVRFADGEVGEISISCDPEGNGGGFIFGLALPN